MHHRLLLNALLQEEREDDEAVIAMVAWARLQQNPRRKRRWWVKPWIQRRRLYGQYDTLFQELDRESRGDYLSYVRMDRNMFAELLYRIAPRITKSER